MRVRMAVLSVCVLLASGLAACSSGSGDLHATATFDDVADLTSGAPVMMSDITIGKVTHIKLDATGRRAKVDMVIHRSADVPADVKALVRRTSALGEKFIDLEPRSAAARHQDAPPLRDHTTIADTGEVADLEQLVSSGTAAFGAMSASQIAILLDEGARAFGGKGPALRQVLDSLSSVAHGYAGRTDKITDIIANLDRLSADLAPGTDARGQTLAHLNDTLAILNVNDDRFFQLVGSLNRLAGDGDRILGEHLTQIRTQLQGLRDVTDAIAQEEKSLGDLLVNLPAHNLRLPLAEKGNFVQALIDVVLCGVPGGGDVPGDPVDACYPGAKP
jgi:phospholipid/cholesterol/gamma-HCH transport system substrate-binding protein